MTFFFQDYALLATPYALLYFPHMSSPQGGSGAGMLWDLGGDILRFPLWWYGAGLRSTGASVFQFVQGYSRSLGLMVWVKNIFTPMFGRYDWQSRLISVFMRVMNIVFRGFAVLLVAIVGVCAFALYACLPVVAAMMAFYHATGFVLAL